MKPLMTLKQASAELGIPLNTLKDICRTEACKKAVHRFSDTLTAPYYIDTEKFMEILRAGKLDAK